MSLTVGKDKSSSLLENISCKLDKLPTKKILLAYSGGVDSLVLLHTLYVINKSQHNLSIRVMHVNHGLQQDALKWQQQAAELCNTWKFPFVCREVRLLDAEKYGVEAAARQARYAAFAGVIGQDECLLTAHHANDQAETVLLQAMRGAGVDGLAAMPHQVKRFSRGWHFRPLLSVPKQHILNYAQLNSLSWCEDLTNKDTHYTRNFLRHKILPSLLSHRPGLINNLQRVADNMSETQQLLDDIASADFKEISVLDKPQQILIKPLLSLSPARQRLLLRYWFKTLGVQMPSRKILLQIQEDFLYSRIDSQPEICWAGYQLRRYNNNLYLLDETKPDSIDSIIPWDGCNNIKVAGASEVITQRWYPGPDIIESLANQAVTIRFRQGGEHYREHSSACGKNLKKNMQAWLIPPWERSTVPLIYCGEVIVAVVGYWKMRSTEVKV